MQHGSTPIPDPTLLTTEALTREIAGLKELLFQKIDAQRDVQNEKFTAIQTQFKERDTRSDQTAKDNKSAIDAAFNAAKEAVSKSEGTTVKQIDQFDGKINDVKDRLTRIEGKGAGISLSWAVIIAVAGLVLAYVALRPSLSPASSDPRVVYVPVPAGASTPALVPAPNK